MILDSAIGKQLKLPVHSILNQSQLNHIWDQYGRYRCLYACTIDDKLVVKRVSVVFVEVRSRYLHNIMILSSEVSCVREHNFGETFWVWLKTDGRSIFWKLPALFALISFDTYGLRSDYNACGILSCYSVIFFYLQRGTCRVIRLITVWQWQRVILSMERWQLEVVTEIGQPLTLARCIFKMTNEKLHLSFLLSFQCFITFTINVDLF